MNFNIKKSGMRKNAFTLLELTVVLLILVALAGVVVPIIPEFIERVHGASNSTSIEEIAKKIQEFQVLNTDLPDNVDTLMATGETAGAGTLSTLFDNGLGTLANEALDATSLGALNDAGITNVFELDNSASNATFGATPGPAVTLAVGNNVPIIDLTDADGVEAAENLGLQSDPTDGPYYVFGLGANCDLVGEVMVAAPVHYPEDESPVTNYERFLIVFDLSDSDTEAAKFATVATFEEGELVGLDEHLSVFYQASN